MSPRRLLLAGAAAGPVFVLSSLVQAALRAGFDLRQQPPSALALGDAGWVQTLTFVLAGIGFTAGAAGLRQTTRGREGRWAPAWFALFGVALVAGGFFRMDPAFGFPPGTPDGVGPAVSWHAAIHGVLFPLGLLAILVAGWSASRRFAAQDRAGMRVTALSVAPVAIVLSIVPNLFGDPQGHFLALWAGVVLAFGWVSTVMADATRTVDSSTAPQLSERTA